MTRFSYSSALPFVFAVVLSACRVGGGDAPSAPSDSTAADGSSGVTVFGDGRLPTDAEVEATRYAGRGRVASIDTAALAAAARANPETIATVDSTTDWAAPPRLPLGGDVAGPSVVKVQTLLDRAGFSVGEIDGRWGDNTELALVWFQQAAGLPATGLVDAPTLRALVGRAGANGPLVVETALDEAAVRGPFERLPTDIYERAELERQGFESLAEALGERFHVAPALLERLNPGVSLDSLTAGARLRVPNVSGAPRPRDRVARIVVSGRDGYLHALADDGAIVFHAPVTLGAEYDPSPQGDFRITNVARDPSWHYQPAILENVPDDREDAVLPPGPNNAVGVVWMALSEPHYGIHGTSAPSTIGTATSSGCIRLTNWDADRLAGMVRPGTTVRFRDVTGRGGSTSDSTAQRPQAQRRTAAPRTNT
ncbi:MAG TPA: L,D-transpeptidase family protein [Rubricoccaceae bacterium]|jgi:lipoprotein-anchoring transpeptidase ErfK/SrfK